MKLIFIYKTFLCPEYNILKYLYPYLQKYTHLILINIHDVKNIYNVLRILISVHAIVNNKTGRLITLK